MEASFEKRSLKSWLKKSPQEAKAAHDTRVILFVQLFFNKKIAAPTDGRMPSPNARSLAEAAAGRIVAAFPFP